MNHLKIILSLLAFSGSIVSQAQTYSEFIQKGDKLYDAEKYSESALEYDKAFDIKEGSSGDYYDAACSWALSGDTINSIKYLGKAAERDWMNLKHIKKDKDLCRLHSVKKWKEVLKKVEANLNEYEKDFDKPLKQRLEKIYVQDQTLRQLYRDAENKFGRDSEEMNYFWKLVSAQDSLNEIEVMKIIDDHGWVAKSLVGGQANTTLWLVIQHAPIEVQEKYLPLLKESVIAGESRGSHLALLEDRIQMRNGKPQIYGSQIVSDPETSEQIVYEIWEPEYVNQRRKEVGLGPIEDYIKRWGIQWSVEQKIK